jgi:hypothetical protein
LCVDGFPGLVAGHTLQLTLFVSWDRYWVKDNGYLPSAWTVEGAKGLTVKDAKRAG